MSGRRARRLGIECPICHEEIDGDLSDHLRDGHSKAALVKYILADLAADEYDTFA